MTIKTDPDFLTKTSVTSAQELEELFDTVGDGSGSFQMAAASNIYKVAPASGVMYFINRVNIYIEDNGQFRGDRYGGSASLENGIDITIHNGSGSIFRYTKKVIQLIGEWNLLAGIDMFYTAFASGNDLAPVRWSLDKSGGPLELDGNEGEFMQIKTQDDMSNLVSHIAQAQGMQSVI